MNNRAIFFAPLPPGCTHIIHGRTTIHAINPLNHASYLWDPTHPTNGYSGSWIPALEHAPAAVPRARPAPYPRAIPIPNPQRDAIPGFIPEDQLRVPPRGRIAPVFAGADKPAVRVVAGEGLVPPGHGLFVAHGDGSYRLQEVNVQAAEEEWEEWEEEDVDWEQVNRWKELAALGRRERRNPASLTSSEERRLPSPERALSERSWPESEVTDPELVERAERRRREQEGRA